MAENNQGTNNNQGVTPGGNTLEGVKKEGFITRAKKGAEEFKTNHPKLAKAGKVVMAGAGAAIAGLIGYALGTKKSSGSGVDGLEFIELDSDSYEEVGDVDVSDDAE